MPIHLPLRYALYGNIEGNPVHQIDALPVVTEAQISAYHHRMLRGHIVNAPGCAQTLIVARKTSSRAFSHILLAPDGIPTTREQLTRSRWLRPMLTHPAVLGIDMLEQRCNTIRSSWASQFNFVEEQLDGDTPTLGLRHPQIGAIYGTLAHWKVTEDVGTVVMPTGTGKTETMLGLLIKQRTMRLLVVVPTAALRDQIAAKFLTLGVLKPFGVVSPEASFPIVGKLEHQFTTRTAVQNYFRCCNVVVSTMNVIGSCANDIQAEIANQCSHLFIDEAHHVPATTWDSFRQYFSALDKPILQFTATPFRRDGKHIGGKIVFNYPLKKAQEEGYFKPLTFLSIWE